MLSADIISCPSFSLLHPASYTPHLLITLHYHTTCYLGTITYVSIHTYLTIYCHVFSFPHLPQELTIFSFTQCMLDLARHVIISITVQSLISKILNISIHIPSHVTSRSYIISLLVNPPPHNLVIFNIKISFSPATHHTKYNY